MLRATQLDMEDEENIELSLDDFEEDHMNEMEDDEDEMEDDEDEMDSMDDAMDETDDEE